jgi:predicted O-methyltransferase YrrM
MRGHFRGGYEERFDANVETYQKTNQLIKLKGRSEEVLGSLEPQQFDFVYIDGSHLARDVLADAVMAWRLLKTGGYLIFDDYDLNGYRSHVIPNHTPKIAINAFLKVYGPYLDVLHQGYQVLVRKKDPGDIDTFPGLRTLIVNAQELLG